MSKLIFFAIHDVEPDGVKVLIPNDNSHPMALAKKYNEKKYGIFWCPNMHLEPNAEGKIVRQAQYVKDEDIFSWYCDIDNGTKDEQWSKIIKSPLPPTRIVESKKGFHIYWNVSVRGATVENFTTIENRIINYFDADKKAKDLVRLLRVPSFYHWKNPKDPFFIEMVHFDKDICYSDEQMLSGFPLPEEEKKAMSMSDASICMNYAPVQISGNKAFQVIKSFNQMDLLARLSGTSYVNGEKYEFIKTASGNYNISVNGKMSPCFIKTNGEIVADKYYGNNIINWLKWGEYNHTISEIYEILKIIVPEAFR